MSHSPAKGSTLYNDAPSISHTTVQRALGAVVGGAIALDQLTSTTSDRAATPSVPPSLIKQLVLSTWTTAPSTSFAQALTGALAAPHATAAHVELAGVEAGCRLGLQGIPARFIQPLLGAPGRAERLRALVTQGHELIGVSERPETPPEQPVAPALVHPDGVYAANLAGAAQAPAHMAILSLCRGAGLFGRHEQRHEFYLIDEPDPDQNPHLHMVVDDAVTTLNALLRQGHEVVVHCHGGRSRTALVLKAWYMRQHSVDHSAAHRWLRERWPLTSTWNHRFTNFLDHEWSY